MKNFTLSKKFFLFLLILISQQEIKSQTVINFENFETSLGIWIPGTNATQDGAAPYQGSKSARFRGTTGMTMTTTAGVNTAGYNKVDVKFFVKASFPTIGEYVALQYRKVATDSWTTVRTYTVDGTKDIRNGSYYAFYATLFDPTGSTLFGTASQFQFISNVGSTSRFFYIDNVSIIGTTYNTITKGPGGVTADLETWLKADKVNGTGVGTDNTALNTWEDVGKGNDASVMDATNASITNRPSYKDNGTDNINFNPVVYFNNDPATSTAEYTGLSNKSEMNGTGGFYTNEQYIVVVNDSPALLDANTPSIDLFCAQGGITAPYDVDGTGFGFGKYTIRTDNEVVSYCHGTTPSGGTGVGITARGYGVCQNSVPTAYSYNKFIGILSARNNTAITGQELFLNANKINNLEVGAPQFSNFGNKRFWLGRSQAYNGSFGGRIAEVITFSNRKNDVSERRKIESYLGIKYGITLGINGTSMNYQNSAGSTVWDVAANSGYNYDIAGIARDDASELNQKQSKSINATEVMTIGLADVFTTNSTNTSSFATDKSFLVWGANGGTMVDSGVDLNIGLGPTTITTITEVVNRKWKVVETGGDVSTVRVNIPTAAFISGLPALGPTDAYVMVVADNATFTSGLETVFMTTSGINQTLLYDFDATHFITFGVAHQAVNSLHLSLDGFDDFVRIANANELGSTFTVMTWIRPNGPNALGDERTIIAKKPNVNSGYKLVLQTDNKIRMEWTIAGFTFSSTTNTAIPDAKWHNIAVTYGAGSLNIYIDGVLDVSKNIAIPPFATSSTFSIGSQYVNKLSILNLFKGDIDELRMWNRVVTPTEIRFIMNQEILQNGTGTTGTIIPSTITKNDISALTWNSLFAYYSMNSYIGTHLDDDSVNINRGSLIIPNKISINQQTAPMPYVSLANGLWSTNATWTNGTLEDIPYSLSIIDNTTPIDWNIVKTTHDINSTGNKTLLGLFVNGNTLSATNDSKIEVSHYLKLNGKIDLVGLSQLVQPLNSDLDATSAGSLEKDQKGQSNFYNYNYWSSPVGTINATTNNNSYTVAGVMKDGTTATPQNITWINSYNGSPTSPVTLSNHWIFKFQNLSSAYANWTAVGSAGSLIAGQGYTMKGSGSASANQTYTFVGKPNNGLITSPIAANNLNLCGNPYASALDATAFINDNTTSLDGNLYFWEHSSLNNSHALGNYKGGYSARNLSGGVGPVAPAGINGLGGVTRSPNRYIPVGQAFFVVGTATGGTITFNNNQRGFVKEDDAVNSNVMFKNVINPMTVDHFHQNNNDLVPEDTNQRIRVGFNSFDGFHRQTLLAFVGPNATNGMDNGYDAAGFDDNPSDMYLLNAGNKLIIEGENDFNQNLIFPIGVKTSNDGNVQLTLDGTENFDPSQEMYIYDNVTNIYNDIKNQMFEINLTAGTYDNRFSLRFTNPSSTALGTNNLDAQNNILVSFSNSNNVLSIKNNQKDNTVTSVSLFNLLGQSLQTVKVENQDQTNILIPIQNLSTGTYIVKINTIAGTFSKKILIK